jgi:hypothetical protein
MSPVTKNKIAHKFGFTRYVFLGGVGAIAKLLPRIHHLLKELKQAKPN